MLRRVTAGDADAYGELVAEHRQSALRVAAVVLGTARDAEDVVQVATERMWRAVSTVDPRRGFRSWYLRGVANTARNHKRSWWRRARAELRLAARPLVDQPDPADAAVTAEARRHVLTALNRLEPEARLVIALRHFEQLSEHEMAEVLECPPGTVKSRLSRAMARLRDELGVRGP